MDPSFFHKVVGGGGLHDFSVSPRPLGFGFGTKGLGPGLDNIECQMLVSCKLYGKVKIL